MKGGIVILMLTVLSSAAVFSQQGVFSSQQDTENLPVVLWHGMGDSCCNPLTMGSFIRLIKKHKPGTYVYSVRIGDNIVADTLAGFLGSVNDQVEMACDQIANDPNLQNGYNAIGFSQGGQFLRAVAQRCPNPRMNNLVSLGGQHQGVFGIPSCDYEDEDVHNLCLVLRKAITQGAYSSYLQNTVVQAQYWHDPQAERRYRRSSVFLADINQENNVNQEYKTNLQKLNTLVLVRFNNDSVVIPRESQWFGFYEPKSGSNVLTLQETDLYKSDKLGLAEMERQNKLHFLELDGDHLQFSQDWFVQNILHVYL